MTPVKLKNGAEYPVDHVFGILLWLLDFYVHGHDLAILEIVLKSRDPDHPLTAMTRFELETLGIIDSDGAVPAIIKDIVLSAVEPGPGIKFTSPVEGDTCLQDFVDQHLSVYQRTQWARIFGNRDWPARPVNDN